MFPRNKGIGTNSWYYLIIEFYYKTLHTDSKRSDKSEEVDDVLPK